jgi:hypothetical protein
MRLLHTTDLELKEFFGDNIPPYCILSHTWEEEEISFQAMQRDRSLLINAAGFQKIQGACKVAISDGFEYIWIDTCCIDKTSSAELSEAINSMFRWYQLANVCYAYLSDVLWAEELDVQEQRLRKSRWFTRGWTYVLPVCKF